MHTLARPFNLLFSSNSCTLLIISAYHVCDRVLETFRSRSDAGKGYQTIMNEALREYLDKIKQPLDEETLRRVIQEELRAAKS
jgi:BrnA antitoxin of type II toxin-antitoxin system